MLLFQLLIAVLGGWLHREQADVIAFLQEENRVLKARLAGDTELLAEGRLLLCDRDPKWSSAVERWLGTAGLRMVRTPPSAPNCSAYAERFVRSVKEECLHRIVPLGERHLRRTLQEFAAHYQRERNHQGLGNELIDCPAAQRRIGPVRRRQRVGGVLSYYYRSAA